MLNVWPNSIMTSLRWVLKACYVLKVLICFSSLIMNSLCARVKITSSGLQIRVRGTGRLSQTAISINRREVGFHQARRKGRYIVGIKKFTYKFWKQHMRRKTDSPHRQPGNGRTVLEKKVQGSSVIVKKCQ